jgi:hypothetical protein
MQVRFQLFRRKEFTDVILAVRLFVAHCHWVGAYIIDVREQLFGSLKILKIMI